MRPAKQSKAKRLESQFTLSQTNNLEISLSPLTRPLSCTAALFPQTKESTLTLPKRPKWTTKWSKEELDAAERASFAEWMKRTQCAGVFERNLEVWRQFWRVTEISDVLLVLLDSRCPPLHIPPALTKFLRGKRVIWILTKSDMVPPEYLQQWNSWLAAKGITAIPVSTYTGNVRKIPRKDLQNVVDAIRLQSLDLGIDVDWAQLLCPPTSHSENKKFLTVGLIGQPNAGKSSLLNALAGRSRVRVSSTPGKTKHLQTIYWTDSVRLVDCPGLVWPSESSMEMQVLVGILPISQVRSPAAVLKTIANIMPLEDVLNLKFEPEDELEDKRTWRAGSQPTLPLPQKTPSICTLDILETYAVKLGFLTAKAGRPDQNRAGNYLLRQIARSNIPWAFLPDTTPSDFLRNTEVTGIWLKYFEQRSALDLTENDDESEEVQCFSSDEDENAEDPAANTIVGKSSIFAALSLSNDSDDEVKSNSTNDSA